ncbi:MAG: bifunctional [glutamate--ammonia ligase]-adenylyl-L-tyrosine phosphorylase/[glutamate--ammonia-ligase] adenylyltransferase, partial [Pseudomonadota bacterium]
TQGSTDGKRPLDNGVFFTRLGQRIIHLLTAVTPAGTLYEVDMRLRPSGNSGLLVSSLTAFADYQRRDAWTWEHQALVRARVVAGHPRLAEGFHTIRSEILGRKRETGVLRDEVVKMRHKMRDHLGGKSKEGEFDLKHDPGGMVDIEFLCQYAVLAMGEETPELLQWSDNMRILETLEATERLPAQECQRLRDAYLALRSAAHRAALTREPSRGSKDTFQHHRRVVIETWQRLLEPPTS